MAIASRKSPAQSAASAILDKIAKKDATTSYALTSPNLQKIVTQQAWTSFVAKEQPKLAKGYTYSKEEASGTDAVMITYSTKTSPIIYDVTVGVEKIEGAWKVSYVSTNIKQTQKTEEGKK